MYVHNFVHNAEVDIHTCRMLLWIYIIQNSDMENSNNVSDLKIPILLPFHKGADIIYGNQVGNQGGNQGGRVFRCRHTEILPPLSMAARQRLAPSQSLRTRIPPPPTLY